MNDNQHAPHDVPLILFSAIIVIGLALIVMFYPLGGAKAQTPATPSEQAELLKWIPHSCCVTANCCFEIPASEIQPVDPDGNEWVIRATGERIARTKWSEDGKFYRCACEMRDGQFVIDLKDRTRCIIPAKGEAGT